MDIYYYSPSYVIIYVLWYSIYSFILYSAGNTGYLLFLGFTSVIAIICGRFSVFSNYRFKSFILFLSWSAFVYVTFIQLCSKLCTGALGLLISLFVRFPRFVLF